MPDLNLHMVNCPIGVVFVFGLNFRRWVGRSELAYRVLPANLFDLGGSFGVVNAKSVEAHAADKIANAAGVHKRQLSQNFLFGDNQIHANVGRAFSVTVCHLESFLFLDK